MDYQLLIVIVIVAGAAFFIGRRMWRSSRGHADGACDKCAPGEGKHGK